MECGICSAVFQFYAFTLHSVRFQLVNLYYLCHGMDDEKCHDGLMCFLDVTISMMVTECLGLHGHIFE